MIHRDIVSLLFCFFNLPLLLPERNSYRRMFQNIGVPKKTTAPTTRGRRGGGGEEKPGKIFHFYRFQPVLPSFTGFYKVLMSFTGLYWVLPSFT